MKIAVIGSGGWGTAIAILLSSRGHNVYLWSWIQEETDRLKKDRENKEFLPGVKFPDTIYCSHDMAECTDGAELIITAAPSPATRTTAKQLSPHVKEGQKIVNISKGLEEGTLGEAYDFIETGVKPELQDYMNGQVLNELEYFLNLYDLEPKVYIAYDRLAYFEKGNDDLRISFDTNIRTRRSDLLLESGDHGKRLLDSDVWLMEIKTSLAKPLWLCEMLSEFEIRSSSFSKYGTEYKNMIARQREMPKQKIFVFGNQKQAV